MEINEGEQITDFPQSFSTGCSFPTNSNPVIYLKSLLVVEKNTVYVCEAFNI